MFLQITVNLSILGSPKFPGESKFLGEALESLKLQNAFKTLLRPTSSFVNANWVAKPFLMHSEAWGALLGTPQALHMTLTPALQGILRPGQQRDPGACGAAFAPPLQHQLFTVIKAAILSKLTWE